MINLVLLALVLFTAGCSCETIPEGSLGLVAEYGAVKKVEPPGLYVEGITENVQLFSVRLETAELKTDSASKDLQKVSAQVAVPYSVDPKMVVTFWQQIGSHEDFQKKVLLPASAESVKAATSGYTANDLITQRPVVKAAIALGLTTAVARALEDKGLKGAVTIGEISITDFDFSPEFNQSIEKKQQAEQDSMRATNEATKSKTVATALKEARVLEAEGEALALETKSKASADAIKRESEALRQNPDILRLRAIQRWNGQLPQFAGNGPVPFLDVKDMK